MIKNSQLFIKYATKIKDLNAYIYIILLGLAIAIKAQTSFAFSNLPKSGQIILDSSINYSNKDTIDTFKYYKNSNTIYSFGTLAQNEGYLHKNVDLDINRSPIFSGQEHGSEFENEELEDETLNQATLPSNSNIGNQEITKLIQLYSINSFGAYGISDYSSILVEGTFTLNQNLFSKETQWLASNYNLTYQYCFFQNQDRMFSTTMKIGSEFAHLYTSLGFRMGLKKYTTTNNLKKHISKIKNHIETSICFKKYWKIDSFFSFSTNIYGQYERPIYGNIFLTTRGRINYYLSRSGEDLIQHQQHLMLTNYFSWSKENNMKISAGIYSKYNSLNSQKFSRGFALIINYSI